MITDVDSAASLAVFWQYVGRLSVSPGHSHGAQSNFKLCVKLHASLLLIK